jgi:hypothetical protein
MEIDIEDIEEENIGKETLTQPPKKRRSKKKKVSKEKEKEISDEQLNEAVMKIQQKSEEALDKENIRKRRIEENIPKIKHFWGEKEKLWEESKIEYGEKEKPKKEWISHQREKYSIPPSYTEEDIVQYEKGIYGVHYQKYEIKQGVDEYGRKIILPKQYDIIQVSREGGKLVDPSKVLILEEEMPPYIRDYIKIPKRKIHYPENYKGSIRYGDKVKFKVEVGENIKEVVGIVTKFKEDHYVINGIDGEKYNIPYNNGSIELVKKKKAFKPQKYVDSTPKKLYKKEVDENIRKLVIEYIFDVVKGLIPGLEINKKYDDLSKFGLSEKSKNVLSLGIRGFDNHNAVYVSLDDDEKYKGYWKYSFDFDYEALENENLTTKTYKYKEKIYVPSYVKDENLLNPIQNGLFYDDRLKAWVYNRYKENVMKELVNNDKVNVLFDQYFSSISSPQNIISTIVYYLGSDIMKKDPDIIIQKIDARKDYENMIYILMVNLKQAIEKNKERLTKNKDEILYVFIDAIKNFILNYVVDHKERLKQDFLQKKYDEYFKSSPPEVTEEIKSTFDSLFLEQLQNEFLNHLSAYIEAQKQFKQAVKLMKLGSMEESSRATDKDIKYGFFSNLSKLGFKIFEEIKNYENECYKTSTRKIRNYLEKVLTPFNFLRGDLSLYTKFFQAKLSSREYHIDELSRMCIAHFFPEFSMNMVKPPSHYKEGTIDKLLSHIQESLDYNIDIFLESYLTLKYLGHIRTTPRITLFNEWSKYIGNIAEKCKEDTNTGFETKYGENGQIVEHPIPLKDIVVCYDEKTKVFKCSSIQTIISDIRKFDDGKIKKLSYDKDLIKKMRERYMEESMEEAGLIENVEQQPKEKVVEKEGYEFIIFYKSSTKSYPDFRDNILGDLKNKYTNIKFFEYNVDENSEQAKMFGVSKYPTVVLVKYGNGKIQKKENITKLDRNSVVNFIDSFIGEEIIMMESYEDLFPVEKIVKGIEQGNIFQLSIPYSELKSMNKEEVINQTSQYIQNGNISFPYIKLFSKLSPKDFVNHKTKAKFRKLKEAGKYYKDSGLYFYDDDYENIDILTSYFTDEARMDAVFTKNGNTKTPLELWKIKSREIVTKAYDYAMNKKKDLDEKALREGIYFARIPECTNFKISLAIAIYNEFRPKIVFDPFAGWGDRALGSLFSDTVQTYIGTDPNTSLIQGYREIREYSRHFQNKKIIFEHVPVEQFYYEEHFRAKNIDLIFSSPPYFDYEIYSNEDTQSIKSHSTSEKWTKWFHDQTGRAFSYLKKGGHLVYYLGNSETLKTIPALLQKYMKKRGDNKFLGAIPTINASRDTRPLYFYVWRKL